MTGVTALMASGLKAGTTLNASLPASIEGYDLRTSSTASATLNVSNTGAWNTVGNDGSSSGTWKTGTGVVGDYEVRMTQTGGSLTSGTLNTWLNLGTTRSWNVTQSTTGIITFNGTVEIRMAASPNTVFDTATVILDAERE